MKTTALALATLVSLSGTAFAGQATTKQIKAPATHAETTVKGKLDYATTGSVDKAGSKAGTAGPRLGIDVSPWVMPISQ